MPPPFIPGLQLCRDLYELGVRPLLTGIPHAAARIGPGSEVLGFDTERSTDHDWGPRLQLFVDLATVDAAALSRTLRERLPKDIHGRPTNFAPPGERVQVMTPTTGPVHHRVDITDVATWSRRHLGFDARTTVTTADWLATPTQLLAEATAGAVYHDDTGELTALRTNLAWYPDPVWKQILAAQWARIAQEEAFVGRTAELGDDLGSRTVAARLARDVMRLCLLLARRYPPYSKWLGTAFAALPGSAPIADALTHALRADDAADRQSALCDAYKLAGAWQNRLRLAPPVNATRRPYFDRPFPVIDAGRFADVLDPGGRRIGAVDQFADSTDVMGRPELTRALAAAVHPGHRPAPAA
ncbi:DUF4037 domain-containing protein [Dactylosporangium vinaceum]|uniref:DUF4037 domain-containing protein n=1 Tax=Dactylosporangium vinaceum TaxID=53362 RepID=A0ABV5MCA7_9ACTN|nr:DUF4037 domain-containing protein [Dactylosporangium vinaceum]UAB92116.1 DUF4037 domain-containing protein [Dactylosporangium vinaceum]